MLVKFLPETIVTVLDMINRLLSSLVNRHIPAVYEAEEEGSRKDYSCIRKISSYNLLTREMFDLRL